jgi:hypothetical protein
VEELSFNKILPIQKKFLRYKKKSLYFKKIDKKGIVHRMNMMNKDLYILK